jgi:hypothetical protein
MKTFVTLVGGLLLTLSCATASDARQQAKRQAPTQSEPSSHNQERGGDSSCFSRSTGIPDQYACSSHGG